jgi:hypothetical protein
LFTKLPDQTLLISVWEKCFYLSTFQRAKLLGDRAVPRKSKALQTAGSPKGLTYSG